MLKSMRKFRELLLYFVVLLVAFFAAGYALGGDVYSHELGEVRLANSPCRVGGVLRWLPEEERPKYQQGSGRFLGTSYFLCWKEVDGIVYLKWEDGDDGELKREEFRGEGNT